MGGTDLRSDSGDPRRGKVQPKGLEQNKMKQGYFLGPPVVPSSALFWGRVPLKLTEKSWYAYSNLSTGGPRYPGFFWKG